MALPLKSMFRVSIGLWWIVVCVVDRCKFNNFFVLAKDNYG